MTMVTNNAYSDLTCKIGNFSKSCPDQGVDRLSPGFDQTRCDPSLKFRQYCPMFYSILLILKTTL